MYPGLATVGILEMDDVLANVQPFGSNVDPKLKNDRHRLPRQEFLKYFQVDNERTALQWLSQNLKRRREPSSDEFELDLSIANQWPASTSIWSSLIENWCFYASKNEALRKYLLESVLSSSVCFNPADGDRIWELLFEAKVILPKEAENLQQTFESIPFYSRSLEDSDVAKFEAQICSASGYFALVSLYREYISALNGHNEHIKKVLEALWYRCVGEVASHEEFWLGGDAERLAYMSGLSGAHIWSLAVKWHPDNWQIWKLLIEKIELRDQASISIEWLSEVIERASCICNDATEHQKGFILSWLQAIIRLQNRTSNFSSDAFGNLILKAAARLKDEEVLVLAALSINRPDLIHKLYSERPSEVLAEVLLLEPVLGRELYPRFKSLYPKAPSLTKLWYWQESLHGVNIADLLAASSKHSPHISSNVPVGSKRSRVEECKEKEDPPALVFVSNLDYNTTAASLKRFFVQDLGVPLVKVSLARMPMREGTEPGHIRTRGFGHVELVSRADLPRALAANRHHFNGRPIFIEPYKGKQHDGEADASCAIVSKEEPTDLTSKARQNRTVFVSGLPVGTTVAQLRRVFAKFSGLSAIRLVERNSGRFRGCAYVEFVGAINAQRALVLDGTEVFLGDTTSKISVAISKPPGSSKGHLSDRRRPTLQLNENSVSSDIENQVEEEAVKSESIHSTEMSNQEFRKAFGL